MCSKSAALFIYIYHFLKLFKTHELVTITFTEKSWDLMKILNLTGAFILLLNDEDSNKTGFP